MEKVKLPRSSYEEVRKIIVGYGTIGKPTGLSDLAQVTGIGKTVISANNAFLAFSGIIEGGNKKSLTNLGGKLARALEHDILIEVQNTWSEIISENEFLAKMIQAVKIRKGMEPSQLENHIAFSSGESKNQSVRTGARAVVDIFIASGVIIQDGEKLVVNDRIPKLIDSNSKSTERIGNVKSQVEQPQASRQENEQILSYKGKNFTLNINLRIIAKPDELNGLGKKIKSIIDDLEEE